MWKGKLGRCLKCNCFASNSSNITIALLFILHFRPKCIKHMNPFITLFRLQLKFYYENIFHYLRLSEWKPK